MRPACAALACTILLLALPAMGNLPGFRSPATTAPMIMPTELKFSRQSIRAIKAGSKSATVRQGIRNFPNKLIKATSTTTDPIILQNVVSTVKKVSELTEADAKLNGSFSLEELKDDLERDFPGIEAGDTVTVITFRVNPADADK